MTLKIPTSVYVSVGCYLLVLYTYLNDLRLGKAKPDSLNSTLILALVPIYFIVLYLIRNKNATRMLQQIRTQDGFTATDYFFSVDGTSGIAFDKHSAQLCFVDRNFRLITCHESRVTNCELIIDEKEVLETESRLFFWFIFAFIFGSISSTSEYVRKVKKMSLKVYIDDVDIPSLHLVFLKNYKYITARRRFDNAYAQAEYWHDKMRVITD